MVKDIQLLQYQIQKKDYNRCARWIHNLGNLKLDIRTFKYSKDKIVCEKHFKGSCFKEDIQAKIMGYTPTRKYLKDDAIPTTFADSKPTKVRKNTEERKQKLEKKELIESLLSGNETSCVDPSTSGFKDQSQVSLMRLKCKNPLTFLTLIIKNLRRKKERKQLKYLQMISKGSDSKYSGK